MFMKAIYVNIVVSLSLHLNICIYTSRTVHEGQRDHKCDLCDKFFSRSENLNVHIRTVHEGQSDHKCDVCGKFFTKAGSLQKHRKLFMKARDMDDIFKENPSFNQDISRYLK